MSGNASGISRGGTGQTTAPGARIALGLEIGVDVQAHDVGLDALAAFNTNGFVVQTANNTFVGRSLTAPAAGITITNPAGTAGNPIFALANDLSALEGLSSTGIAVRTAADTWVVRTLQAPTAGITITNPAGIAGDPTFVLANDLLGVEGLAANGMVARTATDTWTVRTLAGTANEITATNGDGIAGAPTFSLPAALTFTGKTITGGTYATSTISNPTISGTLTTSGTLTMSGTFSGGTYTSGAFNGSLGATTPSTAVIVGVSTNSNAAAGQVGEVISSSISSASFVTLTNNVAKDVTTISLTAGDWDVYGAIYFFPNAATNITYLLGSLSQTTNTNDTTEGRFAASQLPAGTVFASAFRASLQIADRFSLASTTSIFLVAMSTFTVNSQTAYGKIWARRAR